MEPQLHTSRFDVELIPEILSPISSEVFEGNKGTGGLWTSTYLGKDHGSGWVQWCIDGSFDIPPGGWESFLLYPSPNAKVYKIDSHEDLLYLCEHYPYEPIVPIKFRASIDFAKIAEEYDAVHLTERGSFLTRFNFNGPSLMSWDCESVHWFRWKFDKVESLGKQKYKNLRGDGSEF